MTTEFPITAVFKRGKQKGFGQPNPCYHEDGK
jgi:hypothetical protein